METLHLPRLVGSRGLAAPFVGDVSTSTVIIDGAENLSAAQGFVDELVAQLAARHVEEVTLRACPPSFIRYFAVSSSRRGEAFTIRLDPPT